MSESSEAGQSLISNSSDSETEDSTDDYSSLDNFLI